MVLVVVPDGVTDVPGYVREVMGRFKRTEEPGSGRWDYYTLGGNWDGEIRPADQNPRKPLSWENNSCPVAELKGVGGAIVTPDGEWHDSGDCGFRMTDRPDQRSQALERWEQHASNLLSEQVGIVVALDAHS
jgi:hypothetical protein